LYPPEGAGEAAFQEIVVVVGARLLAEIPPGAEQEGGVKLKVKPEAGKIDEEKVHEALLAVPAVVAPQFVVVVLLLKSEFKVPPRPTCAVPEVEFAVKLP
jgi:hypothetical protein